MAASHPERSHPTYNILLLEGSGVVKFTLINALVNYFAYDNLADAEKEEQDAGASATENPKSFLFNIGNANIQLIYAPRVIDILEDPRSNWNFDKLLRYIGEFKELHAIWIVLDLVIGVRNTEMVEYCIKQLFPRLEKSASQNILFLFNNRRRTVDSNIDKLTPLLAFFEKTRSQPPYVEIPFSKANLFCINNEPFKLLLILRNGIDFNKGKRESLIEDWKESHDECLKILAYIADLKPHKLQNTMLVNEARRPRAQLSQVHLTSPDITIMSSVKQHADTSLCKKCRVAVVNAASKCEKCNNVFHPSCAKKYRMKCLSKNVVNCCEFEENEPELSDAMDYSVLFKNIEDKYMIILQQKDVIIKELRDKNQLLEDKIQLLEEKIIFSTKRDNVLSASEEQSRAGNVQENKCATQSVNMHAVDENSSAEDDKKCKLKTVNSVTIQVETKDKLDKIVNFESDMQSPSTSNSLQKNSNPQDSLLEVHHSRSYNKVVKGNNDKITSLTVLFTNLLRYLNDFR